MRGSTTMRSSPAWPYTTTRLAPVNVPTIDPLTTTVTWPEDGPATRKMRSPWVVPPTNRACRPGLSGSSCRAAAQTETWYVVTELRPLKSVAVAVTVNVPELVKVWLNG